MMVVCCFWDKNWGSKIYCDVCRIMKRGFEKFWDIIRDDEVYLWYDMILWLVYEILVFWIWERIEDGGVVSLCNIFKLEG